MSQPPTSSTMEHCEISLHPWPSSQSAAGFQQSVSSAVDQDGILQHPQPSTSSTLTHIPQNDHLSSVVSRHAYYSSSSESEPFQDSGETYVPSKDEQDSLSEDEQSTESSGDDESIEVQSYGNVDAAADQWEPCRDIPLNFQYTGNGRIKDLLNEGRTLYIDNFYTSVQLCKALLNCKTYVCGTVRQNRKGNPPTVCKKKLRKGEVFGQQNQNGIRVMKWLDKRPVLMISTCPSHQAELKATGKKTRKGEDTFKPQAVIDYNNAKKGVDISDQMSSYYTCIRKSIKWYKKVFFEILLGTCMVNSWVIYNYYGRNAKKLSMLQFREQVARGLLEEEDIEENIEPEDIAANVPEQRATRRPRATS
ncbi:unnamed protein product [Acanthoscelides obtectus]|uniref:PiggyBac transposable element-derived protein domain-containing protein n=1 Tax=Acanthoscelides obtectus TaxID=200917 RepID=A0A9P0LNN2_ACAOB|nr:unnamed protein product [Acanthoscelides obtectus]CAK1673038.1 PiggyBac transposable element-derived protein 4 [Acanthoscelides obtectus]